MPVRIGFLAPQFGADAAESLACARDADQLGLDLWLAGQMMPMPTSGAENAMEPLALMGAMAAVTERARLGFMALAAPYLPSLYLAKGLLTLNEISGGRLEVGIGAGWRKEEFAALDLEFAKIDERLAHLERTLDALTELSGPAVREDEQHWPPESRAGTGLASPPVWIAGSGPKILDVAARRADWTNFARGIPVADFVEKNEAVDEAARAAGRKAGPKRSLTATFLVGEGADFDSRIDGRARTRGVTPAQYVERLRAANVLVGAPAEVADQMGEYVDAGCEAFVLWPLDGRHRQAVGELGEVAALLK